MADTGFINSNIEAIADRTISIEDFFKFADERGESQHSPKSKNPYAKKAKNILKVLTKAGVDIKQPYYDYLTLENATDLMMAENTKASHFRDIFILENHAREGYLAQASQELIENKPYAFTPTNRKQMGGTSVRMNTKGLAHSVPEALLGDPDTSPAYATRTVDGIEVRVRISEQTRNQAGIVGELPTISELGQVLKKYIKNIEDINVREAVLFNLLTMERPGEVAGLSFDDIDFDNGMVKPDRRQTKLRQRIKLSTVPLEILKRRLLDEANKMDISSEELDEVAKATGLNDPDRLKMEVALKKIGKAPVFDVGNDPEKFVKAMSDTTNHKGTFSLVNLMKPYEKGIQGKKLSGAKYIRKLSATILASTLEERNLPTGVVSTLLGHIDDDVPVGQVVESMVDMSQGRYVGARLRSETGKKGNIQIALDMLEAAVGISAGASNVNGVPEAFDIKVPSLDIIDNNAEVIDFPDMHVDGDPSVIREKRKPTKWEKRVALSQQKLNYAENLNKAAGLNVDTQKKNIEAAQLEKVASDEQLATTRVQATNAPEIAANKAIVQDAAGDVIPKSKDTLAAQIGLDLNEAPEQQPDESNMQYQKRKMAWIKAAKKAGIAIGTYVGTKLAMPAPVAAGDLIVDAIDFTLTPSPAGIKRIEDISSDELMTRIQDDSVAAKASKITIQPGNYDSPEISDPEQRRQAAREEATSRYVDDMDSFIRRRDTAEREAKQQGLPEDTFKQRPKSSFLQKYEAYFNEGTADEYVN